MREWLLGKSPHLRQRRFGWRPPIRVMSLISVVIFVSALVYWGMQSNLKPADWAAWIQAFGSIAAIAGAWALGRHQIRATFRQAVDFRNLEHVERVRALFPIAARAYELVQELESEPFDHYYSLRYSEAAFRNCQRAIESIPLHELGKYGLFEGYLELQEALESASHAAANRLKIGQMNLEERQIARASQTHISNAHQLVSIALEKIQNNQPIRASTKAFL